MTTMTTIKQVTFEKVIKQFKKFVGTSDSRPVLKYVHFDGQYFVATNSHYLIRVKKEVISDIPENIVENILFCPNEMKLITGEYNYPQTNRLIPEYENIVVNLNKSNIKDFIQLSKEVGKQRKERVSTKIKLEFTQNYTNVSTDHFTEETEKGIKEYKKTIENVNTEVNELTLHVNYNYLRNTLEAVKELMKLSNNETVLNMTSNVRPVHFKSNGIYDIILLPIRVSQ